MSKTFLTFSNWTISPWITFVDFRFSSQRFHTNSHQWLIGFPINFLFTSSKLFLLVIIGKSDINKKEVWENKNSYNLKNSGILLLISFDFIAFISIDFDTYDNKNMCSKIKFFLKCELLKDRFSWRITHRFIAYSATDFVIIRWNLKGL